MWLFLHGRKLDAHFFDIKASPTQPHPLSSDFVGEVSVCFLLFVFSILLNFA